MVVIRVDGTINGVKERFISRAIDRAEEDGAALLVVELTRRGDSWTRRGTLWRSCWVPLCRWRSMCRHRGRRRGRRERSSLRRRIRGDGSGDEHWGGDAGFGHGEDLGDTLASKVENDTAAFIRSIAQEPGA